MDEAEEARHLANTGEVRKSMQQQLEFAEQRDTITKFELVELKKLHDDLAKSLANMKDQNSSLVDPILDSLKKEVIPKLFLHWFSMLISIPPHHITHL